MLGDAANDPNAKLKINYDKHEFVSFDKKTIFGTRAQLDFGNANSFIGATALYFNQSIINEKVTVNFENMGKLVINAKNINLEKIEDG